MQNSLQRVAVIGAGREGWKLAARTARAGYFTVLEDLMPSALRQAANGIRAHLGTTNSAAEIDAVIARVSFASTVEEAVREADLALDCVPDELESKLEIFCLLDRMAPPRTILCTPTETLSIADIASCTYRADRCIAVGVPAGSRPGSISDSTDVRLICTPSTQPEVLDATAAFWRSLGMRVSTQLDASMAARG